MTKCRLWGVIPINARSTRARRLPTLLPLLSPSSTLGFPSRASPLPPRSRNLAATCSSRHCTHWALSLYLLPPLALELGARRRRATRDVRPMFIPWTLLHFERPDGLAVIWGPGGQGLGLDLTLSHLFSIRSSPVLRSPVLRGFLRHGGF